MMDKYKAFGPLMDSQNVGADNLSAALEELRASETMRNATAYLGATMVAPGTFAFRGMLDNVTPRWFVISAVTVRAGSTLERELREALDCTPTSPAGMKAFQQWRAENCIAMPPWWTPEHRVYCKACHHASDHTDEVCYCSEPCDCKKCGGYDEAQVVDGLHPCCCDRTALEPGQLVTADLASGEEIPA